jgi:hypothetical protein
MQRPVAFMDMLTFMGTFASVDGKPGVLTLAAFPESRPVATIAIEGEASRPPFCALAS